MAPNISISEFPTSKLIPTTKQLVCPQQLVSEESPLELCICSLVIRQLLQNPFELETLFVNLLVNLLAYSQGFGFLICVLVV